ncbi:MAG: hypothetical protein ACRDZT_00265, partial [Acidimicrobiales bacterium]
MPMSESHNSAYHVPPVVLRTPPRTPVPMSAAAVVLDERDTIAVAKEMLVPGTVLLDGDRQLHIT